MATVFFSDFSDCAKLIIGLDIWLAVLLLFSSFVAKNNTRWWELNSQMSIFTFNKHTAYFGYLFIHTAYFSCTERSNFNNTATKYELSFFNLLGWPMKFSLLSALFSLFLSPSLLALLLSLSFFVSKLNSSVCVISAICTIISCLLERLLLYLLSLSLLLWLLILLESLPEIYFPSCLELLKLDVLELLLILLEFLLELWL